MLPSQRSCAKGSRDSPNTCNLLLFGDLSSASFEQQLRHFLHDKSNPLLVSFFEQVRYHLRRAVEALPVEKQELIPRFTDLIDLVSRYGETKGTPILKLFLFSVCQVAQAINLFSETTTLSLSDRSYAFGPCAGGFAAAAVCCSRNVVELVSNGVAAVLAAFHIALISYITSQTVSLQSCQQSQKRSWSALVTSKDDFDIEKLMEEEVPSRKISPHFRPWISAITSAKSSTISGLPSALQSFMDRNSSSLKHRYLDIHSPFHAAHLYSEADILQTVRSVFNDGLSVLAKRAIAIPLLSSATGKVFDAPNFQALIFHVSNEALRFPIRCDIALPSICKVMQNSEDGRCNLFNFSSAASTLISSQLIRDHNIETTVFDLSSRPNGTDQPTFLPTKAFENSKIAIIGYSGRFPTADSNDAFWELLKAGKDVHQEIPATRFDWKMHYDASGKKKNTSRVKYGCFINEPGLFDARFFNMSPKEAENTDPAQRLAITTAYEAMEMAGLVPDRTPSTQKDRVGVFFGTTSDDWREVNSGQNVGTYFIPGGNRAFVPGRISYFFGFSGPSLSIDTACSSSFAAIQSACGYLWRGDCDTAIAGGTNVLTNPDNFAGLDRGHFLSTTGNCNAFDDGANGYCRSEAVGSIILKRLEDAQADNDPIFGVIAGTTTNHCGQTDSITRPHEGDQTSVFKRIVRHANIDPLNVSYVEMHGTGTQAGDATEMNSVLSVFTKDYERTENRPQRSLYLGSAKANIGHAESASGVSSLIKVLMMMKHSEVPRHCGIKTKINHNYPLDMSRRGVHIASTTIPWQRNDSVGGTRTAFLNNFSAAGGNTAILLQDAPVGLSQSFPADPRSMHIVTISAKSSSSLLANMRSFVLYMQENLDNAELPQISYTTTTRRIHHKHRVAVNGENLQAICTSLQATIDQIQISGKEVKPVPTLKQRKPRVVFMFSGQGTLYRDLAKPLFVANPSFRSSLLRLDAMAQRQGFSSFLRVIDGSTYNDAANNASAMAMQLALTCVQIALVDLWASWGVHASAAIGHSLGEYAAFYAAGVLSAADIVYLVGTRARLLEQTCEPNTHAMLAIHAPHHKVSTILAEHERGRQCEIACNNSTNNCVVAGPKSDVAEVNSAAVAAGLKTTLLDIPFAFHSAQVEPFVDGFKQAAGEGPVFHPPKIPYLSPLLGKIVMPDEAGTLSAAYLANACRGMVDFASALRSIVTFADVGLGDLGSLQWLEIGSHPVCGGMVKETLDLSPSQIHASMRRNVDSYNTITSTAKNLYMAGLDLDWNEYHRDFPMAHSVVELPSYQWDLKNYWISYRNNFCLTKGDLGEQSQVDSPAAQFLLQKYISPSAQRVLTEHHDSDVSTIEVESDIFDPRLLPILQGHLVNATALCPSSLYADIALTLAEYLLSQRPADDTYTHPAGFEVVNVNIDRPLIAQLGKTSQLFNIQATAKWTSNLIQLRISSPEERQKSRVLHCTLDVRVTTQPDWLKIWERSAHLINSRIEALAHDAEDDDGDDECNRMKRRMAYKLFSTLVDYSAEYQGMSEVVLHGKNLEAVAKVRFQVGKSDFHIDPRWIDSLGQVAGFIMNANDEHTSNGQVFINHGWQRIRFAERLDATKTYRAYNRMHLVENTTYAGDTYILDGTRIVAIYEGVTFKGIPRHVLNHVLPNAKTRVAPASAPATTTRTTQISKESQPRPKTLCETRGRSENPRTAQASATTASSGTSFDRLLAIVGEEVGIEINSEGSDNDFAEFGVDSLLSLNIIARARDELNIDLPSSLFVEYATVQDLRTFFNADAKLQRSDTASGQSTENSSVFDPAEQRSDLSTPPTEVPTPFYEQPAQKTIEEHLRVAVLLREIVSQETGVEEDLLEPSTNLLDIGVDSLLGLTISSRLQEAFGAEVSSSIFLEFETMQDIEKALNRLVGPGPTVDVIASEKSMTVGTTPGRTKELVIGTVEQALRLALPVATSILLSGKPQSASRLCFLFPDGSGSASSYVSFSEALNDTDTAVYGLNCPWRKNADDMTRLDIDMRTMVRQYIIEVERLVKEQRRQKQLVFGGWSAGGILAFEGARELQRDGRLKVEKLLLFDSPNPIGLQNPPQRMYDFFDTLGIFGTRGKAPQWLRAHFEAFLRVLDEYEPSILSDAPQTLMIYARDGVCKDPAGPTMETFPDDPREMLWLLNNRTDFSAHGWGSIINHQSLRVEVVDNVNHFSLMDTGPQMTQTTQMVTEFLKTA